MNKFAASIFICFGAVFGLTACQEPLPKVFQSQDCWLDGINGNSEIVVATKPTTLAFTGWAGDSTTEISPKSVSVQIIGPKGAVVASANSDAMIARPDVAQAQGKPGYEKSGFNVTLDGAKLTKGEYGISIAMHSEGAAIFCPTTKKINIQ